MVGICSWYCILWELGSGIGEGYCIEVDRVCIGFIEVVDVIIVGVD